jgi:type IV secretion system protein VirB6
LFSDTLTLYINNSWGKLEFDWVKPGSFVQGVVTIIIVIVGALPFIITSFAYIIIAKIMISLLLSFGPIFISFAFFPSMRRNFEQWSAQCLNYIFLTALYSAAFSLMIVLINKFAVIDTNPESGLNFQAAIYLAIVFAACLAVTMEIPALASQLAGGVGISGLVGSKVSGVSSGAAAAAGGAMGGLLGAMGGNKLADKARELRDKGLGSMGDALKNSWHTLTNKGSIRK